LEAAAAAAAQGVEMSIKSSQSHPLQSTINKLKLLPSSGSIGKLAAPIDRVWA